MDNYQIFEQKLKNREMVMGPCITGINSTILLEKMAPQVDYFLFDCEHGVFNSEMLITHLQISRLLKKPAIVRVADCVYDLIARVLYMGADGIMIPRCETLEQVKSAVEAMNFYPDGKLGCGGHGQFRAGEDATNYKRYLVLQIESSLGVKNLPEMLKEYGEFISAIVVGPYDMSITMNKAYQFDDPQLLENINKVFEICDEYKKSVGIFVDDVEKAERYSKMGANFMWVACDINIYVAAFNDLYGKIKEI